MDSHTDRVSGHEESFQLFSLSGDFVLAKHSFIFQEIYSSLNSVYLVWLPCHFNGWMTPECAIVYRYLLMVFKLVTCEKKQAEK
jgi:hypothetical protein